MNTRELAILLGVEQGSLDVVGAGKSRLCLDRLDAYLQEILVEEPGVVSYAVWHKGFVGEYYRCADCGELHSQFDEDAGNELRLDDLEPPEER